MAVLVKSIRLGVGTEKNMPNEDPRYIYLLCTGVANAQIGTNAATEVRSGALFTVRKQGLTLPQLQPDSFKRSVNAQYKNTRYTSTAPDREPQPFIII